MKTKLYRHHFVAAVSLVAASLISLGSSSDDIGFPVKAFMAAFVDKDNTKWFLTDQGIVSFNGEKWTLHNGNRKVESQELKGFAYEANHHGQEMWIASPKGVTVATLPVDARSGATTYHTENTTIISNNVLRVAVGKSPLRWFGTDKGVTAFNNDKWLTPAYEELYPEAMFQDFPITSMATSLSGDSLFVGTDGAGVSRVYRDEADGISGASALAQWGPILLPSDKIYSICITPDGKQWFGTDLGAALHTGNNALENWTVYNTENGLVNNFVQAITTDDKGRVWFGTKEGVSVFDGTDWKSYTKDDGLNSNNVQCIAVDRQGLIWLGTDDGVNSFYNGEFKGYR